MKKDIQLLCFIAGECGFWEASLVRCRLAVSADARKRDNEFRRVHFMFSQAFRDEDELYQIKIDPQHAQKGLGVGAWLLAILLLVCASVEWVRYTLPNLTPWVTELLHRCGL